MIPFQYTRVASVAAALQAIRENRSSFIAGGTNLVDLMKKGVTNPEKLVDISRLPFKEIRKDKNNIRIGAMALNSTVAADALVRDKLPLVAQALAAGASPQIRNMATVGGNLLQRTRCPYFYDTTLPCNKREPGTGCSAKEGYNRMHAIFGTSDQCIAVHPSDLCVALAALDTTVIVASAKGERSIPFADFHRLPGTTPQKDTNLQPGELITALQVQDPGNLKVHYLKIRDRASYAFALVSVAGALELDGNRIKRARLAMGGVAHKPWRLLEAERFLTGKTASLALYREAAALAMRGARAFEHNRFKLTLAPNAIVDCLSIIHPTT